MKKIIIPLVIVAVVIGVFVLLGMIPRIDKNGTTPPPPVVSPSNPPPANIPPPPVGLITTMHMKDSGYEPKDVTVKVGTVVTFVNDGTNDHWPASNIHPTHAIYPEFDTLKGLKPGESWAFTFDKAGIWRYHDHLFPSISGKITVEE